MISNSPTKVRIHADHVGSLLRPHKLKETRAQLSEQGVLARFGQETQPAELSTIEDTEIEEAVRFQEEIGLPVVTDGEFRRAYWHYDFMGGLTGLDLEEREPESKAGTFALSGVPFKVSFRF